MLSSKPRIICFELLHCYQKGRLCLFAEKSDLFIRKQNKDAKLCGPWESIWRVMGDRLGWPGDGLIDSCHRQWREGGTVWSTVFTQWGVHRMQQGKSFLFHIHADIITAKESNLQNKHY